MAMSWSRSFIRASFIILWLLAGLSLLAVMAAGAMGAHDTYGKLEHMGKALRSICAALMAIAVISTGASMIMMVVMFWHIALSVALAIINMHERIGLSNVIPLIKSEAASPVIKATTLSPNADDIEREQVRRFNNRPVG